MILRLHKNKTLSIYRKTPVYIGEHKFNKISVLLPESINDDNLISELSFKIHIVNNKGEYLLISPEVQNFDNTLQISTDIDKVITDESQMLNVYIEMFDNEERVGKTNTIELFVNPLPDETERVYSYQELLDRIAELESGNQEQEEIIKTIRQLIEENTEAMNRINGFENGKSAYEVAVDNGFVGTESEWLLSLKGNDGYSPIVSISKNGKIATVSITDGNGTTTTTIVDGDKGDIGLSAYQLAVANGFSGTEQEWLLSLKGNTGSQGIQGQTGADGKSAYQVALDNGFVGTENEWLNSLKGSKGDDGNDGQSPTATIESTVNGVIITITDKNGTTTQTVTNGRDGINGINGVNGNDGYSPTATVTQTQSGATVSITDKNGTTTANISNGVNGSDYILTAQDKSDIADLVLSELPTTQGVQYGNTGN